MEGGLRSSSLTLSARSKDHASGPDLISINGTRETAPRGALPCPPGVMAQPHPRCRPGLIRANMAWMSRVRRSAALPLTISTRA
jgi:hypothetical protein